MKPTEFEATFDAQTGRLRLKVHIHELKLDPAAFLDAAYEKKGDTMVLRLAGSMTKYRFETWEKSQSDPRIQAVKAYIDHCERARLAGRA